MIYDLLTSLKVYIEEGLSLEAFPEIPVTIDETTVVYESVLRWTQEYPQYDLNTVCWCLEKLCISGKSFQEAFDMLGIPMLPL